MDGTILNTEDIYTECSSELLAQYGKGPLTWDVKIGLQGRPGAEAAQIMVETFELPLSGEEFMQKAMKIQESKWKTSQYLPGALELLQYLHRNSVPIALGTSSNSVNFQRKTSHLQDGFSFFGNHIVTGDDSRIPPGKGKPHPHIWYACLDSLNQERHQQGLDPIAPEECLIFEDGIPGVKSGLAANSHVVWIPHPEALQFLNGKENDIIGDNGVILNSLVDFDVSQYSL